VSLIIFSCSPRPESTSNSAAIARAFREGFTAETKESADIYYLYQRKQWEIYQKLFEENTEIIFAMPLFVECVPGLLMEFLESLRPKEDSGEKAKMAFILQSGFEEACQLRTAERYLETLPGYLGCAYAGTLLKGGMFALSLVSEIKKAKMLQPFFEMGKLYARERRFEKTRVTAFAAPERYSKGMCLLSNLLQPISNVAWKFMARKLGANGSLDARPYDV